MVFQDTSSSAPSAMHVILLMGILLGLNTVLCEPSDVVGNWINPLHLAKQCTVVTLYGMILASYAIRAVAVDKAAVYIRQNLAASRATDGCRVNVCPQTKNSSITMSLQHILLYGNELN